MPISTATPTGLTGVTIGMPVQTIKMQEWHPAHVRRTAQDLIKERIEYLDRLIKDQSREIKDLLEQVNRMQADLDAWAAEKAQLQEDLGTLIEKALED